MVRLEELSNRQFRIIGHLTQQVAQLRAENDQLRRNGLITVANVSAVTTAAAAYVPPFNSLAGGDGVENQDAMTSTNTIVATDQEREEVWKRVKEDGKARIQVVYRSSAIQPAKYQYPGTFEQQLQRPVCWRSDRPISTSLAYLAPEDSASRLLSLPKELRMQIWIRAIGGEATLGFNWDTRSAGPRPREKLTHVLGAELPLLRLTNSIINEDLRGYAKPVITVSFMNGSSMCMHLVTMEKYLRSRISIIKVHGYDSEVSHDIARTIIRDRGLESNATSIYGVQEYFAGTSVKYINLLGALYKRFSVMNIDMHQIVLELHEERYEEPSTPPKECWVLHSTFRVRRPYGILERPYRRTAYER